MCWIVCKSEDKVFAIVCNSLWQRWGMLMPDTMCLMVILVLCVFGKPYSVGVVETGIVVYKRIVSFFF